MTTEVLALYVTIAELREEVARLQQALREAAMHLREVDVIVREALWVGKGDGDAKA